MTEGNHTITFDRAGIEEYKTLIKEATEKRECYIIVKNMLVKIWDAEKLVRKFEPHFVNPNVNEATIKYDF